VGNQQQKFHGGDPGWIRTSAPPRVALSAWIETNVRLPEGVSALPGAVRLWPYQREIADAISDPEIERAFNLLLALELTGARNRPEPGDSVLGQVRYRRRSGCAGDPWMRGAQPD